MGKVNSIFRGIAKVQPELFKSSEYVAKTPMAMDMAEYNARRADVLYRRALGKDLRMQQKGAGAQLSFDTSPSLYKGEHNSWDAYRKNLSKGVRPIRDPINIRPEMQGYGRKTPIFGGIDNTSANPLKIPGTDTLKDNWKDRYKSVFNTIGAGFQMGGWKRNAYLAGVGAASGAVMGMAGNMINPNIAETDPHYMRNAILTGATVGALGAAGGAAKSLTQAYNKGINPNISGWMSKGANMVSKVADSRVTTMALMAAAYAGQTDTHFCRSISQNM